MRSHCLSPRLKEVRCLSKSKQLLKIEGFSFQKDVFTAAYHSSWRTPIVAPRANGKPWAVAIWLNSQKPALNMIGRKCKFLLWPLHLKCFGGLYWIYMWDAMDPRNFPSGAAMCWLPVFFISRRDSNILTLFFFHRNAGPPFWFCQVFIQWFNHRLQRLLMSESAAYSWPRMQLNEKVANKVIWDHPTSVNVISYWTITRSR